MVNGQCNTTAIEEVVQTEADQKAPERLPQEHKIVRMSHVSEHIHINFAQPGRFRGLNS